MAMSDLQSKVTLALRSCFVCLRCLDAPFLYSHIDSPSITSAQPASVLHCFLAFAYSCTRLHSSFTILSLRSRAGILPCCLVCCVFAVFCVIHFLCSLSSRSVCALHHSPHSDVHCNRTPRYRFASLLALDSASFFVLSVPSLFTHVLHSFHPISASAQSAHHTVSHTIINSPILLVFASVYSPLTQFPRFCFTPSLSPSPHH